MKERNNAIELLRVLLMFGIVLIHVVGKGAYSRNWLANLLKVCVPGFIFITGYYGVRFSWAKLIRLYGVGLFAALCGAIGWWAFLADGAGLGGFCQRFITDMRWFWFLHAYAILLLTAPILNACIEHLYENSSRGGG